MKAYHQYGSEKRKLWQYRKGRQRKLASWYLGFKKTITMTKIVEEELHRGFGKSKVSYKYVIHTQMKNKEVRGNMNNRNIFAPVKKN